MSVLDIDGRAPRVWDAKCGVVSGWTKMLQTMIAHFWQSVSASVSRAPTAWHFLKIMGTFAFVVVSFPSAAVIDVKQNIVNLQRNGKGKCCDKIHNSNTQ